MGLCNKSNLIFLILINGPNIVYIFNFIKNKKMILIISLKFYLVMSIIY